MQFRVQAFAWLLPAQSNPKVVPELVESYSNFEFSSLSTLVAFLL